MHTLFKPFKKKTKPEHRRWYWQGKGFSIQTAWEVFLKNVSWNADARWTPFGSIVDLGKYSRLKTWGSTTVRKLCYSLALARKKKSLKWIYRMQGLPRYTCYWHYNLEGKKKDVVAGGHIWLLLFCNLSICKFFLLFIHTFQTAFLFVIDGRFIIWMIKSFSPLCLQRNIM